MSSKDLIGQLQERGLISKLTDEKALIEKLSNGPLTLYCGFDPTADSLHLGHLIPLLCLKRFQQIGHRPIILIGGATGLIGDPSFKSTERKLNTSEKVQEWVKKIEQQISLFLNFDCGKNSAKIVNNYDWFSKMNILPFLCDIGKHFSVKQIMNKGAIKQRLKRYDSKISFTEFSYNLLQSYDFANLYYKYNVELQIGGSDQWGNITLGIDFTRRLYKKQVFGLTLPLITKSDGTKFGKTETNTIWLDPQKTSPYKFYQFWLCTSDIDVYRFLKFFTFMSIEEIDILQQKDFNSNKKPQAQYILAEKITKLVHGDKHLQSVKRITKSLFANSINLLTISDFSQLAQDGMPMIRLNEGANLQQALVKAKLVPSYGQARIMINSNAIIINGKKCIDTQYIFNAKDRLFDSYSIIRRGKKHYCLVNWD
ncbi:MAG: tyrosine--tRNA ligase [Arsenophonus endosymbiont of Ceratovacuna japonica]